MCADAVSSNPALTGIPEPLTLSDYVSHHARVRPRAPAFTFLGATTSYAALNAQADRLAVLLGQDGVRPGDVIGVHLPNIPQYLVALVAAAKLGAVVTGVSPLLTTDELAWQVNDAGISVLITLDLFFNDRVAALAGRAPGLRTVLACAPVDMLPAWTRLLAKAAGQGPVAHLVDMPGVRVLRLAEALPAVTPRPMHHAMTLDDVLFIQYTGGTTGRPKGAVQTVRSIFGSLCQLDAIQTYREGEEVIASAFPYFHMAGLSLAVVGLQKGARLLVIPDPRDVKHFCQVMRRHPPTLMANVPTLYQMLMDYPGFARVGFAQLRMAVSGAAPFAPEQIRRLEGFIGAGKLCEGYGMTETSGVTLLNPPGRARVGTIGLPLPATRVKVVDTETGTREVAPGQPGEMIISGSQVMAGYLRNPEATAATIRDFQGEPWLYTGDVAVQDEAGYLTIVDRMKDMLIVGGYKVFSAEVESKLGELPYIALCALVGHPDRERPGNDVVHLYVQLQEVAVPAEQERLRDEIRAFCRAQLSPYKVPKHIHFLPALPLTAVGKLDKKALRVPVAA